MWRKTKTKNHFCFMNSFRIAYYIIFQMIQFQMLFFFSWFFLLLLLLFFLFFFKKPSRLPAIECNLFLLSSLEHSVFFFWFCVFLVENNLSIVQAFDYIYEVKGESFRVCNKTICFENYNKWSNSSVRQMLLEFEKKKKRLTSLRVCCFIWRKKKKI